MRVIYFIVIIQHACIVIVAGIMSQLAIVIQIMASNSENNIHKLKCHIHGHECYLAYVE